LQNNKREYVIEFLKAFYEKYSNIHFNSGGAICNITVNNKNNLLAFADFFEIPHVYSNLFNLVQLTYTNVNIIDLLGIIYKNKDIRSKERAFNDFLMLLNNEMPTLKYIKMSDGAITPTKANFSDVGYDISIIGLHKTLNENTSLYKTGIKLEIPVGYYVELVPRSSLSKSGYMLANSIGIIDCSYKGELLVALTKISDSCDIEYPFRCCQLIMKKQIYPIMVEIATGEASSRADGGFGSTS
jgi:dUTP pyrophosphatase